MKLNTEEVISISRTNQNFSCAPRLAYRKGRAIIFRHNKPKYMLEDIDRPPDLDLTDDEKIDIVAARILKQYTDAFQPFAQR